MHLKLFVTFFLLVLPATLQAQEQGLDEQAKAAYQNGQALFAEQKFDDAAAAFGEAYALKPSWKILYNKGQAEAAAKRYGLALASFEACLALSGDELQVERKDELLAEIRRMRDMVGSLEVKGPDGAVVLVDGVERGTLPLDGPVRIVAGTARQVEIRQQDDVVLTRQIRLGSGDNRVLDVFAALAEGQSTAADTTVPAPTPVNEETEPGSDPGHSLRLLGWTGVGMGAAALIVGSVTGAMALKSNATLADSCDGGDCLPGDHNALDKRDLMANLSTGFFIGGGVVAATGVVLLIAGKKREAAEVSVVPGVSRRFAGLAVTGRF